MNSEAFTIILICFFEISGKPVAKVNIELEQVNICTNTGGYIGSKRPKPARRLR